MALTFEPEASATGFHKNCHVATAYVAELRHKI